MQGNYRPSYPPQGVSSAFFVFFLGKKVNINIHILRIPTSLHATLRRDARQTELERCGYLYGRVSNESANVAIFWSVPNSAKRLYECAPEFDPKPKRQGHAYIGFYHSHSGTPVPSSFDIEQMEVKAGEIWLIGGFVNPLRYFTLRRPKTSNRGRFILSAHVWSEGQRRQLGIDYV